MRTEPDHSTGTLAGFVTVVLTLAGWSSIPLFLRHFIDMIDPWTANGWRYAISALMWLPVLLVAGARKKTAPGLWRAALVPSLFNIPAQICFAFAPYMVPPGLMTFSMRVHIVFLTIGAAIFFAAERRVIRTPLFLSGVAMVVLGTTGTILLGDEGLGVLKGASLMGVLFSVGAGFLYAGYSLSVRRFMHGIEPFQAFSAVSQYTGVALVALMLLFGRRAGLDALDLTGANMTMLVLSAVVGIGIGHTLYYFSIARLGLAVASGVVQLQPITVSIASYFIFGEKLNAPQWASGSGAIAGAGLMLYAQHRLTRTRLDAVKEMSAAAGDAGA